MITAPLTRITEREARTRYERGEYIAVGNEQYRDGWTGQAFTQADLGWNWEQLVEMSTDTRRPSCVYWSRPVPAVAEVGDTLVSSTADQAAIVGMRDEGDGELSLDLAAGPDGLSVATITAAQWVRVQVDNAYACGRRSSTTLVVRAPGPEVDLDDLDWWTDEVPSGDGHPCGAHEDALYSFRILAAPGRPELIGRSLEWG